MVSCKICSEKKKNDIIKNQVSGDGLCDRCSVLVIAQNRYFESNIPVEYWNLGMDEFKGENILLNKYNEITKDLSESYRKGIGICFAGNFGVGKTCVITNILKKAAQKNFTCLYSTLSDIVSVLLTNDFIAKKELMMVDFLAIDEFDGRFMPSENSADLFGRTLEIVFRTRAQNKLPLFMATNSPNITESFNGPIKQSIESLMKGYIKIVPIFGTDFRKINK